MAIILDGTAGITTPELDSSGPVAGTTANFSGNVTLGSSVLATPTGSAPSYTCRAWVNFDGTGTPAIREDGNVSSITDNSTGIYTINFTTAMPDTNYTALVTAKIAGSSGGAVARQDVTYTTTELGVFCYNTSFTNTDAIYVGVAIFR